MAEALPSVNPPRHATRCGPRSSRPSPRQLGRLIPAVTMRGRVRQGACSPHHHARPRRHSPVSAAALARRSPFMFRLNLAPRTRRCQTCASPPGAPRPAPSSGLHAELHFRILAQPPRLPLAVALARGRSQSSVLRTAPAAQDSPVNSPVVEAPLPVPPRFAGPSLTARRHGASLANRPRPPHHPARRRGFAASFRAPPRSTTRPPLGGHRHVQPDHWRPAASQELHAALQFRILAPPRPSPMVARP
jgi:hypothetical protein